MFLNSSRYRKQKVVDATAKGGRRVRAVTLRRLPSENGKHTTVKGNDRLDIMAYHRYGNATMFWHIADANAKLQANDLVKTMGACIDVPER